MKRDTSAQNAALVNLRRRWGLLVVFSAVLLWSSYNFLRSEWHSAPAGQWTLLAGAVVVYELGLLWRHLKDNHRLGESILLSTLGPGNSLTLFRGLTLALLAGFLLLPRPAGWLAWLPALLYSLAIGADYLDGYLARITHHATLLGEALDIEFDALGILVATGLAVHYRQLPWWYLFLGLSRYLFVSGIWVRKRRGKPVFNLPPSGSRRMVAGFQMGFISVTLWPLVYPPGTTLAGLVFAGPFLASFLRDWLIVSGYLDPSSPSYLQARRKIAVALTGWLPILLRMGIVALIASSILLANAPSRVLPLEWWASMGNNIRLLALVGAAMLVLGIAGRLAALGLLIAASTHILANGLYLGSGLLLVSSIALMMLGSGPLSWWRPEETFLSRRPGE